MLQDTFEVLMRGKDQKYFEDNSLFFLKKEKEAIRGERHLEYISAGS